MQEWHIKQCRLIGIPQAVAETDMYMEAPKGLAFDSKGTKTPKDYVLQIKWNYYGQKQGARVWNLHPIKKLEEGSFTQSEHEECLLYRCTSIYVLKSRWRPQVTTAQ